MEEISSNVERQITSLSAIKDMTQRCIDRKESLLGLPQLKIIGTAELGDIKKQTNAYRDIVERNDIAIDLIVDIKDTILKIKLVKNSIDKTTQVGANQIRQMDYYIGILNDLCNMLSDVRSKLDRDVRYYEKTYSYYREI